MEAKKTWRAVWMVLVVAGLGVSTGDAVAGRGAARSSISETDETAALDRLVDSLTPGQRQALERTLQRWHARGAQHDPRTLRQLLLEIAAAVHPSQRSLLERAFAGLSGEIYHRGCGMLTKVGYLVSAVASAQCDYDPEAVAATELAALAAQCGTVCFQPNETACANAALNAYYSAGSWVTWASHCSWFWYPMVVEGVASSACGGI